MGGLGPFSGSIWRYFLLGGFSGSKREVCPRRAASGALEVTSLASQLGFLAWLPSGASGALEVTSLASQLGFPTEFMFGVDASIIYGIVNSTAAMGVLSIICRWNAYKGRHTK